MGFYEEGLAVNGGLDLVANGERAACSRALGLFAASSSAHLSMALLGRDLVSGRLLRRPKFTPRRI
jgi:hypothetical protein